MATTFRSDEVPISATVMARGGGEVGIQITFSSNYEVLSIDEAEAVAKLILEAVAHARGSAR